MPIRVSSLFPGRTVRAVARLFKLSESIGEDKRFAACVSRSDHPRVQIFRLRFFQFAIGIPNAG